MVEMDNSSEFGAYLKEVRERNGLSVNELSSYSEVSNAQISRIERGIRGVPKPETILKLAKALKVPYEEMMKKAGYLPNENVPSWASSKDKRDFKKMLEEDGNLMFDGLPLDEEDRRRILDVLTGLFWEAKKMNKRKPIK